MDFKTKDFFSNKLMTISKWETPVNGLKLMKENFIRHLPVVDEKTSEIVGLVSDRDLLAEMSNRNIFIGDIMTTKILAYDIETPLKKIVDDMIDQKVSSFLIKRNDKYCGIITSEDMLQVLSMVLGDQDDVLQLNLIPFLNFKYSSSLLA